ncbi:MAG: hypothetical protein ACOYUZ_00550 [Patescibacteria group bacterium]
MNFDNPFQGLEHSLTQDKKYKTEEEQRGVLERKMMLTRALRRAELSASMKTGQYSEYHTEGERVGDHYRLIFNIMRAIIEDDDSALQRLPEAAREALGNLDESIKKTIREYPNLIRYIVLTHDIAKTEEGRSFNEKKFKMPEGDLLSEAPAEAVEMAREYESEKNQLESHIGILQDQEKNIKKDIQTLEKQLKNKKSSFEELGDAKLKIEARKKTLADFEAASSSKKMELDKITAGFYDDLKKMGLTGREIFKYFGLGVGFVGHEAKSAEAVRGMEIPEETKKLLARLAEDHIIPLQRFNYENISDNDAATFFIRSYGEYDHEEFRLSLAMAALDILGSVREGGNIDLTPINNILRGRREAWVNDRVKEKIDEAVASTLEEEDRFKDLKGVDVRDKNTPIPVKQKYSQMRKEVEARLKDELRAEFEELNNK